MCLLKHHFATEPGHHSQYLALESDGRAAVIEKAPSFQPLVLGNLRGFFSRIPRHDLPPGHGHLAQQTCPKRSSLARIVIVGRIRHHPGFGFADPSR
jgi:hypothetical protein